MTTVSTWDFDKGLQKLQDAADLHAADAQACIDDETGRKAMLTEMDKAIKAHNPELAWYIFIAYVCASNDQQNHKNILGFFEDNFRVVGRCMAASADETELSNELKNLFSGSVDPKIIPEKEQVSTAYDAIDHLITKFSDPNVKATFNEQDRTQIVAQLKADRANLDKFFNKDGTTTQDPVTHQWKFGSFTEMNAAMNNPDDQTKHENAVDAYKAFFNASQALTIISQNFNTSLSQKAAFWKSLDQAYETGMSDMAKKFLEIIKTAVQNQISR